MIKIGEFSLSEIASILEDGFDFLKKLEQKEKEVGCEIEVNKEKNIDVEICEAVVAAGKETKDLKFKTFGAVKAACILHKGPYQNLGQSYGILINWLKDNDYEPADFFRESYIDGCWNKDDPKEWLTEIQVPIKKK